MPKAGALYFDWHLPQTKGINFFFKYSAAMPHLGTQRPELQEKKIPKNATRFTTGISLTIS